MPIATLLALGSLHDAITTRNYYEILEVPRDASRVAIREAFHAFALRYHPDRFIGEDRAVVAAATDIFKRGVEAYRTLSRPQTRVRYDRALSRGKLRLDSTRISSIPPPPALRTLEMIARSARAQTFARAADRFLSIGELEEAMSHLRLAIEWDEGNRELVDRLEMLEEAISLEGE